MPYPRQRGTRGICITRDGGDKHAVPGSSEGRGRARQEHRQAGDGLGGEGGQGRGGGSPGRGEGVPQSPGGSADPW